MRRLLFHISKSKFPRNCVWLGRKKRGEGSKNFTVPKFLLSCPCSIPQEPPLQNAFRSACCSPNADGNKSPTRHHHHWVAEKGSSERRWKLQSVQNTNDFVLLSVLFTPHPQFIKYFKVYKARCWMEEGEPRGRVETGNLTWNIWQSSRKGRHM